MVIRILKALSESLSKCRQHQLGSSLEPREPRNPHGFEQHGKEPHMKLDTCEHTVGNVGKRKALGFGNVDLGGTPHAKLLVPGKGLNCSCLFSLEGLSGNIRRGRGWAKMEENLEKIKCAQQGQQD